MSNGLIPQSVIEEVLARTDVYQTVQQYVALKRSGSSFKGLCPFHGEKTPSFYVHPAKGFYKCFGCGAGGNVIQFLMSIEGWNFPETVRQLAERCGVDIPEASPEEEEKSRRRREGKKLYSRIMELARAYFEDNLWSDVGQGARMYLEERAIDEPTARAFGLGHAPAGWQNLLDHLQSKGIQSALVERAGLANSRDGGNGHYDRFRHRITFPIVDVWGQTLAFGARTIAANDTGPKYINSPETSFYTKGEQLYGLDVAKTAIQKAEFALVVEGNFDVISLHARGLDMTVAPMGTALTESQARLISRYAKRVVIAFDGDGAGQEATLRCLPALEKAGLEAQVIEFDAHDDPDTFIRRHGREAFDEKLKRARPLVSWALDRLLMPVEQGPVERKLAALEEVSALLGHVSNPVGWEHYAQEVSRRLTIEARLLKDYLRRPKAFEDRARQAVLAVQESAQLESAEYGILVVILDCPQWLEGFFREELDKLLSSQELAEFLKMAFEHFQAHGEINGSILLGELGGGPLYETVTRALAEPDHGELYQPEMSLRWYQDCVHTLKKNWAQRTLDHLMEELDKTDFQSDRETYTELLAQHKEVSRFKKSLDLETSSLKSVDRGGP
ncbi:MAG: DNA primase [Bradymonadaceae bacterium]